MLYTWASTTPLGAMGYVPCGDELNRQISDFDAAIVPSGSGATHGGFLTGLHLAGQKAPVYGICVRRGEAQQRARMVKVLSKLAVKLDVEPAPLIEDINVWDGALAPGYGLVGDSAREALTLMARTEGIFLDPVYTAKTFAGLLGLLKEELFNAAKKLCCFIPADFRRCLDIKRNFNSS
ncbi:pyridoxal-phosphate dependent enzyme [Parasedimentitalea marina]|uniref:pyridoxal-phosphate dependent enzyme n=1 Tax=Parasedimentitalea marina TaxID=2483033 RepID=UPI00237B1027|nr:pyridoxal-phosphate dependent enzyme [Parasedimentitalea marina]